MPALKFGYILIIFGTISIVGQAVRITKFQVPEWFEISDDDSIDNKLELDCAYEMEPNEKGITLQWYFNDTLIYQWLPEEQHPPHTFNNMRHFIDTNATLPDSSQRRFPLVLLKPTRNMTGEYTCQVGSFKRDVKRGQHLQMITPESDLKLKVLEDEQDPELMSIECIVKNIYPSPNLKIIPEPNKFTSSSRYDNVTGLFSSTTFAHVRTNQTNFMCYLTINGTGYHRSTNNSASDSDSLSDASSGSIVEIVQLTTLIPLLFYIGCHIHSISDVFH